MRSSIIFVNMMRFSKVFINMMIIFINTMQFPITFVNLIRLFTIFVFFLIENLNLEQNSFIRALVGTVSIFWNLSPGTFEFVGSPGQ